MLPKFPETAISLSYNSHHSLGGSYPSMRVLVHGYKQTRQIRQTRLDDLFAISLTLSALGALYYAVAVVASQCEVARLLDFTICFFRPPIR